MRKIYNFIFLISIAAFAASCSREMPVSPQTDGNQNLTEFRAVSADTKTAIENGHTVWALNDRIKVFIAGGEPVVASIKTGEGTQSATFQVSVPEATDYYAVYPSDVESSMPAADSMILSIPPIQSGDFGACHIAVAKAKNKVFTFNNINAFLKISLKSATYNKISIQSVGGNALTGMLCFGLDTDGIKNLKVSDDVQSYVEITSASSFAAGDYYLSILPGVIHEKGLLIQCYDGEELKGSYFLDKEITTAGSKVLSFGEFEPGKEYFVSVEGSGNKTGLDSENAMDVAAAKKFLVKNSDPEKENARCKAIEGATFNFAYGTYDLGAAISIEASDAPFNIVGSDSSGDVNWTVISGGDTHKIVELGDNSNSVFKDIHFSSGQTAVTMAKGTTASFQDCKFTDCRNMSGGGAVFSVAANTKLYCNNVIFDGNASQEAAVYHNGSNNNVTAYFNRCTIKNNYWTVKYGGILGIAKGKTGLDIAFNNCSIFKNFIDAEGLSNYQNTWVNLNSFTGTVVFTNTTFWGRTTIGPDEGDSKEKFGFIRVASNDYRTLRIVNCVIANTHSSGNAVSIYGNPTLWSKYSLLSPNSNQSGSGTWDPDDGSYHTILGRSTYYTYSVKENWVEITALKSTAASFTKQSTATINSEIQTANSNFYTWLESIDALGKDCRGYTRDADANWPGAFDYGAK